MPVTPATPYPTVTQIIKRARAKVNDAYQNNAGRILTDRAPFTVEYINSAFEMLQERMRNNTIVFTRDNVLVGPIPSLAAPDPGQQIMLAYTGLFVNGDWTDTVKLPSDCVAVEKVWERAAGSATPFAPMTQPMEGLPSVYQGPWLRMWEYRQDMIVMPGSTTTEELRLRYEMQMSAIAPDTVVEGNDSWNNVTVNILNCTNALGQLVAYEYASARGAQAVERVGVDAEKYIRLILNRYIRRAQGIRYNRRAYGSTNLSSNRSGGNLPW